MTMDLNLELVDSILKKSKMNANLLKGAMGKIVKHTEMNGHLLIWHKYSGWVVLAYNNQGSELFCYC